MNYDNEIVEFLLQPENLPIALEVTKQMVSVRRELHKFFWMDFQQALSERFEKSDYKDKWTITFDDEFEYDYKTCSISVRDKPKNYKGYVISISIQQNYPKDKFRLCYGICWNQAQKSIPNLDSFLMSY